MADLIGTATIRVDMPTATAVRQVRRFATQGETQLRGLQNRITSVAREMRRIGDRTIAVTVDDRTRPGATSVRATVTDLQRLGPVRIPVQINDGTRRGAASVQTTVARLQRLGPIRIDTSIDTDPAAIATAATALRGLQDAARGTARALGTLATRATAATAALVALGAAARTLRGDMDDLDGSIRRVGGGMTGLRGRLGTITTSAGGAGSAMDKLKTAALLLSPALVPIAAQAIHILPLAANFGAAAVAVGAFGIAVGGQIASLSEAAQAEKKAADAAEKYGARSKQAAEAQAAHQQVLAGLPPATRKAAAAFTVLKDQYKGWSDALAGDTMPVVTKSFAVFGAVLPKLTPVVKGASTQLSRFMTILGGGVQTRGFDRVMDRFASFSSGVLKRANDGLIHFMRTLDTGQASGAFAQVMQYAQEHGPLVRDVLTNVASALANLLEAGANVGPGLLTVVNALAGIVAAVPPGAITVLLQVSLAIKAVGLAARGAAVVGPAVTAFAAAIGAMRTAAAGASGVLPRLAAGFMALSRAARIAVAGTGIGLLVIALTELAEMGRKAPPDVDKMTTSLGRLAQTGKASGEAARVFGPDFKQLGDALRVLERPSNLDKTQQFLTGLIGMDSTPVKDAKEAFKGLDEGLTALVKGGKPELAAAALEEATKRLEKQGFTAKEVREHVDGYKSSLADLAFEQDYAVQAMGAFGQQAQATSSKLAEQKASADGLRQAIQALNDVNRAGLGAQSAFEESIDALAKAAKKGAGSLRYVNGELDLSSKTARDSEAALRDTAQRTEEYAASARESGASWEKVNKVYARGREELMKQATTFFGSKKAARQYVDAVLDIPDEKSTRLKMEKEDAENGLKAFNAAVKKTPGTKSVTLKTLSKGAEEILKDFGYKVKRLPDGRVTVSAKTGKALSDVRNVKAAVDQLRSKSITIFTKRTTRYVSEYQTKYLTRRSQHDITGATGGLYTGAGFKHRGKKYARGGPVVGPGTGTSDSIMAPWLSNGEFVVNAKQTAQHLPLLKAINSGQMGSGMSGAGAAVGAGLAAGLGGATRGVEAAARALAGAVTRGVREELQIASPSLAMKALAKDVGKGFIAGLTDSRDKIKAVSKDLAADVRAAFSGRRESTLLKMINRETKELLAAAKQRDAVEKKIAAAKKFAADTADRARATGSLASIVGPDFAAPRMVEKRMKSALSQIKQFTTNVQKLQKRGVSKALLRQILELGPEQGGAFAEALAGADAATIKRYNKLQADLDKQSKKLGNMGADMLYDSGKKAGDGFLTGLKAQQKQIEKLMLDIAKGMQKSIRKALGIKSPSRVMWEVGALSMDGLRGGLLQQVPAVQRVMDRVAGAVATSMPAPSPAAHSGVSRMRPQQRATDRPGPRELHVHVHNTGVIGSQFEVENWLARSLDHLSRTGRIPAARTP